MNAPHDNGIDDLLREVGPRVQVPADIIATVHAAVINVWHTTLERRQRQRRNQRYAFAAGIVAVLSITVFSLRARDEPPVAMARVLRIDGRLQVADASGALHTAQVGETLLSGTQLATDPGSHAALDFGDGLGLRLATASTLRLSARGRVALESGTLYVDSSIDTAQVVPLTVQTVAGSVHHIGTQYQVRTLTGPLGSRGIEISIREGQVQVEAAGHTSIGSAGERLSISARGQVVRSSLSALDPSWQWASRAAPQFDIAGHSLDEFLRWAAHETGRKLSYDSAASKSAAEALQLGGSIAGLDPDTALGAVLSTTKLRSSQPAADALRITLRGD
jgi:hypothetical protein